MASWNWKAWYCSIASSKAKDYCDKVRLEIREETLLHSPSELGSCEGTPPMFSESTESQPDHQQEVCHSTHHLDSYHKPHLLPNMLICGIEGTLAFVLKESSRPMALWSERCPSYPCLFLIIQFFIIASKVKVTDVTWDVWEWWIIEGSLLWKEISVAH